MGIEFNVAAKAEAAKIGKEEDVVEVPIDGKVYFARRPTAAALGLLTAAQHRGENYAATVFDFIESMMGKDALAHIRRLIIERRIEFDDLMGGSERNPKGLVTAIIAEFSGRPTVPSTGSTESPKTGGRRSTARTPGKGSISSASE